MEYTAVSNQLPNELLTILRMQEIPAAQHDAWDLGMVTTDDFTQAEVRNYRQAALLCKLCT